MTPTGNHVSPALSRVESPSGTPQRLLEAPAPASLSLSSPWFAKSLLYLCAAVSVALVIWMGVHYFRFLTTLICGSAAFLGMLFATFTILCLRADRGAERAKAIAPPDPTDPRSYVEELVRVAYHPMLGGAQEVAFCVLAGRRLLDAGHAGSAVRIARKKLLASPIEPYAEWFEPTPLSWVSEQNKGNKMADTPSARKQSRPRRVPSQRRSKRSLIRPLGLTLFCGVIASTALSSSGRTVVLLMTAWLLVCVLLFFIVPGDLSRWRWFIVPGGVVIRRSSLLSRKTKLEYYSSKDSVLFVIENQTQAVLVGPDGRTAHRRVTATNSEALLCAWLSPLEPPTDEQLSDLAG